MTVFENDRELLKAFRAGERAALSKVYRFYADDVAGLVRRGFAIGDAGVDEGRRLGVIKALAERADDGPAAVLPVAPEEELEWNTLREATKRFANTLIPALQDFVRLRFEEGCSQADLAQRLNVSRRKVRTMEDEVRDGLRAHLRTLKLLNPA